MTVLEEYFDNQYVADLASKYMDADDNDDINVKKYGEILHIARTEVRNGLKNHTPVTTWYNYLLSL